MTRRKFFASSIVPAGELRYEGIRKNRSHDHTKRLKDREDCQEETAVLGNELEAYGRVDGNVAPNAKAHKRGEDQDSMICIGSCQGQTKNGCDQDRQVEGILATNDVDQDTPDKRAGGEAC